MLAPVESPEPVRPDQSQDPLEAYWDVVAGLFSWKEWAVGVATLLVLFVALMILGLPPALVGMIGALAALSLGLVVAVLTRRRYKRSQQDDPRTQKTTL